MSQPTYERAASCCTRSVHLTCIFVTARRSLNELNGNTRLNRRSYSQRSLFPFSHSAIVFALACEQTKNYCFR